MTTVSTTFQLTVQAPPAYGWLPAVGEWTQIAGSAGLRHIDQFGEWANGGYYSIWPGNGAAPGPVVAANRRGNTGPNGTINYCGATSDQDRNEYIMCANGGDGDYPGNETYILRLNTDTPRWHRLNDPSPNVSRMTVFSGTVTSVGRTPTYAGTTEVMDFNPDPLNLFGGVTNPPLYPPEPSNGQQRPRAMHTYGYQHYVKGSDGVGRVWFANMGSMSIGPGGSLYALSFNRDQYGALSDLYAPPAYGVAADSTNPWTYHQNQFPLSDTNASLSVYDPVDRKIWRMGSAMNDSGRYHSMNVSTPGSFVQQQYFATPIGSGITKNGFSVLAPLSTASRLWIVGIQGSPARVWIRNVASDTDSATGSTAGVIIPGSSIEQDGFNWDPLNRYSVQGGVDELPVPISGQRSAAMSAVYHDATKSILIVNPYGMGGTIRQLLIPTTGGEYDINGTNSDGTTGWKWKTFSAGGTNSNVYNQPTSYSGMGGSAWMFGTWNRAQLFSNVGGATIIVYAEDPGVGTYVYRVS